MSKIIAFMGMCANKLIDLFSKKAKSGEKAQDIEIKKVETFSNKTLYIIAIILIMCMLASLFPKLAITDWWFEKADIALKYIFSS